MSETETPQISLVDSDQKAKWNYRIQKWDLIFKSITTLSLIFGAIWGLMEYFDRKDQEFLERQRDYQFMLYKERKETLYPLCNAAADIVSSKSLKDAEKAIKTFETLYFGEVGIIADGEISEAIRSFVESLLEYKEGPQDSGPPVNLIEQSSHLAMKCKEVLNLRKVYGMPTE
jgi:hypothetical protein